MKQLKINDKQSCVQSVDGNLKFDRNHAYYYQMQQQLEICNEEMECQYGDFVVRTQNEIFIESTLPANKFWEDNLPKLDNFFEVGILPVIVGKYCTILSLASEQTVYKILVVISQRIKIPTFQIQGNSGALVEAMKQKTWLDVIMKTVNGNGFTLTVLD